MDIEILQTRDYRIIGAKAAGETCTVPDDIGAQFVAQGFAREIKAGSGQASKESKSADEPKGAGPAKT